MLRHTFLLFCGLLFAPAFACINMYERIPGVELEAVERYTLGGVDIDRPALVAYIRSRTAACTRRPTAQCNDLVIAHLYAGDMAEALDLSTKLVERFPKVYHVVITHAAALELNGRPAEAQPFMERALELDPGSHKGSEWIHANILRQRASGNIHVRPEDLIGVDLRPDSVLVAPANTNVDQLLTQVHYQVNDRLYFTPDHDPLFGALVFAYADLLYLNKYRSIAEQYYDLAKRYGYVHRPKPAIAALPTADASGATAADTLPAAMEAPAAPPEHPKASGMPWRMAGLAALVVGLIILLFRLRRKA